MYLDQPRDDDSDEKTAGLLSQLGMMIRALLASSVRNTLFLLAGMIFMVIVATAYGQIRLNRWNQPFYDALARHDFSGFMMQLGVFCVIAGGLLVLNVAQRWLAEMLKLRLREGLVQDLVNEWLKPHRAFRLAKVGPVGTNPDQRMHEDARHLTELSSDLGVQLLQSSILLVTFTSILWKISGSLAFRIDGQDYSIPGYMVWAAVVYAGSGSMLSYWVGRGLINRNANRYQREAELRTSLNR
ncbi:MAG: SbmA/BacA-like family transporter, partial [Rhizomicrobium sp.]